jgi:hypothetical protein
MARLVLNTDVACLSYEGRLPPALAARLVGYEVCVTFVTIGELARWAESVVGDARPDGVGALAGQHDRLALRRASGVEVGPTQRPVRATRPEPLIPAAVTKPGGHRFLLELAGRGGWVPRPIAARPRRVAGLSAGPRSGGMMLWAGRGSALAGCAGVEGPG